MCFGIKSNKSSDENNVPRRSKVTRLETDRGMVKCWMGGFTPLSGGKWYYNPPLLLMSDGRSLLETSHPPRWLALPSTTTCSQLGFKRMIPALLASFREAKWFSFFPKTTPIKWQDFRLVNIWMQHLVSLDASLSVYVLQKQALKLIINQTPKTTKIKGKSGQPWGIQKAPISGNIGLWNNGDGKISKIGVEWLTY